MIRTTGLGALGRYFGARRCENSHEKRGCVETRAIKNDQELAPGPRPSKLSANILKRITIRNNSDSTVKVRVYYQADPIAGGLLDKLAIPQAEFFVPALADYAYVLSRNGYFKIRINENNWLQKVRKNKMIIINDNGHGEVTNYLPKFLTV